MILWYCWEVPCLVILLRILWLLGMRRLQTGFSVNNDQLASVSLLINLSGSTLQHYLVCSLSVEVLLVFAVVYVSTKTTRAKSGVLLL